MARNNLQQCEKCRYDHIGVQHWVFGWHFTWHIRYQPSYSTISQSSSFPSKTIKQSRPNFIRQVLIFYDCSWRDIPFCNLFTQAMPHRVIIFFHDQHNWACNFYCPYSKMLKIKTFAGFHTFRCLFIMLINVKVPTIVDTLRFMSRINLILSWLEHENKL